MKKKCKHCDNIATWVYVPNEQYYCDAHVPRGCTCNVMDLDMEEPDDNLSERTIWWSKDAYQKCFYENGDYMEYCTYKRQPNSFHYEILDENYRRSPCCEYDYSPDGFNN